MKAYELRTELLCDPGGHSTAHAKGPSGVGRSAHNGATHYEGLFLQRGIAQTFDSSEEGVHVDCVTVSLDSDRRVDALS